MTTTINGSLNPYWNESIIIKVMKGMKDDHIIFKLMHSDATEGGEILGYSKIKFNILFDQNSHDFSLDLYSDINFNKEIGSKLKIQIK